mmetsp:Transcript_11341/g.34914  ORF Transcript_11341/g.34914 Transcript_11341/m.34914 type:complete len:125 (+) Transcript_11341:728-1102(+)
MPLYHQIVTASARAAPAALAELFRRCAKTVVADGGVVRSCEHYGVRRLPHRHRSRHASAGAAGRHHAVARLVALYFDCRPATLTRVEQTLRMHEAVLRFATLRPRTALDRVNSSRRNNPWRAGG